MEKSGAACADVMVAEQAVPLSIAFVNFNHTEDVMSYVRLLLAMYLLFALDAEAQRREIGNGGRGGSLSSSSQTERPARSESMRDVQPPPPPPPPQQVWIPAPVVVENTVYVSQTVVVETQPQPQTRQLEVEPNEQAVLYDTSIHPSQSGFDFSSEEVVSWLDREADMYFVVGEEGPEFVVNEDTDIQSVGEGDELLESVSLPSSGWSPAHRVAVQPDVQYVVWTWDNQYYVFRVTVLAEHRVAFEWRRLGHGATIAANIAYRNGTQHRDQSAKFGR